MSGSRNLSLFLATKRSLRNSIRTALWHFVFMHLFKSMFFTSKQKSYLLRTFGSVIGSRVNFRRAIRIHLPWNLEIGDDCWIGEDVWFINHEKVKIGSNVCISQRSIICSGGHDYRSASLEYAHKPIEIKNGAWVCLDAKVLPGVTIGECSVVSAGEIVRKSVPDSSMLIAGEIRPINPPK